MPKRITELLVFVSSPEELAAERQIIQSAIEELNPVLKDACGVQFKAVVWREDVVPGIGAAAQDVINSQTAGKYDIYIGLLGARFGTPTARAGSGTEEEFNLALERYRQTPDQVRVMLYFKTAIENVFRCDLDQMTRVMNFRETLGNKGVLFCDFGDKDTLLQLIKTHVRHLALEQWDGENWKVISPVTEIPQTVLPQMTVDRIEAQKIVEALKDEEVEENDADGVGILDAVTAGESAFIAVGEALDEMTSLMQTLAHKTNQRAAEMKDAASAKNSRRLKSVVDASAGDLSEYGRGLRKALANLNASFNEGVHSLETVLDLELTEPTTSAAEMRTLVTHLTTMMDAMRSGREGTDSFRETVTSLPGYTGKFKRSKRNVAALLSDLSATITVFLDKSQAIQTRGNSIVAQRIASTDRKTLCVSEETKDGDVSRAAALADCTKAAVNYEP